MFRTFKRLFNILISFYLFFLIEALITLSKENSAYAPYTKNKEGCTPYLIKGIERLCKVKNIQKIIFQEKKLLRFILNQMKKKIDHKVFMEEIFLLHRKYFFLYIKYFSFLLEKKRLLKQLK